MILPRSSTSRLMKEANYALLTSLLLIMLAWAWQTLHPSQFSMPLVVDSCRGQRIFMYHLPTEFNTDIFKECESGLAELMILCSRAANDGFGPPDNSSLGDGWFHTDTYMLEIIFHERMKQYSCLTPDPAMADAVFVPYYAGLDALRYFGQPDNVAEYSHGVRVMSWLGERDEWKRCGGKDHFIVMGGTAWDFGVGEDWGTGLLEVPGVANMTLLMIDKYRRPWPPNQQAIPYPTSFHPSSGRQIEEWTNRVRASTRTRLFAFAGSVRTYVTDGGFRSLLIDLCSRSPNSCRLVDCVAARCRQKAEPAIRAFMESVFCLQPPGDTPTRRSTFDAIIAGCIPVFFNRDSAYTQYTWHLPTDSEGYSVFIPQDDVVADDVVANVSIVERVLKGVSPERVREMQEKVVSLIPRVIYTMKSTTGNSKAAGSVRDAFDITVEKAVQSISETAKYLKPNTVGLEADVDDDIDTG